MCIDGRRRSQRTKFCACGDYHSIAAMDNGDVYSWCEPWPRGSAASDSPAALRDNNPLSVAGRARLGFIPDNRPVRRGLDDYGQLGLGDPASYGTHLSTPQLVVNLVGAAAQSASGGRSHAAVCTAAQVPVVSDVQPRSVPLGRSRVWVLGSGFAAVADRSLSCSFAMAAADGREVRLNVSAAVFSNFRAVCWTVDYPGLGPGELQRRAGEYRVSFVVDGQTAAEAGAQRVVFQLKCPGPASCAAVCAAGLACFPAILSLFPLSGPSRGGSDLHVAGVGFDAAVATDARCGFGDAAAGGGGSWSAAAIVSSTRIACPSAPLPGLPPGLASAVSLRVTLNGQDYSAPFPYLYYAQPQLSHASAPASLGPAAWQERPDRPYGALIGGGTVLNVHGYTFAADAVMKGDSVCDFGFARSRAVFVSPSVLLCTVPPCASTPNCTLDRWEGRLSVLLNGQDPADHALTLVFYNPPSVFSVFPRGGPDGFEAAVRVKGLGFGRFEWFPRCQFGPIQRDAYVLNDTDVLCSTPPVNLSSCCSSPGCSACSMPLSYLANAQNPADSPGVSVRIYQRPALAAIVPGGAPRTLEGAPRPMTSVTLVGAGFGSVVEKPYIRFLPNTSASGVYLRVNSSFYPELFYRLDSLKWSLIAQIFSSKAGRVDYSATCLTPTYSLASLALVDLTLNGQDFFSSGNVFFRFYDQPTLRALTPQSGPLDGGTLVVLSGSGLRNFNENILCRFSAIPVGLEGGWFSSLPGTIVDDNSIRCLAPPGATTGPVQIAVTLNGNDYSDPIAPFVYYSQPEISNVQPAGGPTVGGTVVLLLFTQALARDEDLMHLNISCSFGGTISAARLQADADNNGLICIAPAGIAQMVMLQVSLNGEDYGSTSFYTYYSLPKVISSIPTGAVPFRPGEQSAARVTVVGSGFSAFSEGSVCRFGCYTSPANTLSDEQLECEAPWPSSNWELFLPYCTANEHVQSCAFSDCGQSGCSMRQYTVSENITCILDVWLEVSLNGFDFTLNSKLNFRFYQALASFDFRPSGGPVDGQTEVEFIVAGQLGGFQRLNDGSFTTVFGNFPMQCEARPTELILEDEFDSSQGMDSNAGYELDAQNWAGGSGVKASDTCGSSIAKGLWFTDIVGGNIQGFGARLTSRNSTSKALTFTGASAAGWAGRYALTQPLDLSRGFRITFKLGHGDSEWPDPCDRPEEQDAIQLLQKPVSYFPAAVPPKYRERKYWDVVGSWTPTGTSSGQKLGQLALEVGAKRAPLGSPSNARDTLSCAHNVPCMNSPSQLIFFEGSHGQGPFDVWVIDDVSVLSFGGIMSDTRAVCKSPPQAASCAVTVKISLNGQQYHTARQQFRYYVQPSILKIQPSGGHIGGGTVTTISGSGFQVYIDALYSPKCKFATATVPALIVSNTSAICVSPPSIAIGYVKVAVALNGVDFTSDTSQWTGVSFIYFEHPKLSSVFPDSGPESGGTFVNIVGQGFMMLVPVQPFCKFVPVHNPDAVHITQGSYINDTLISCSTPNVTDEFSDDESAVQAVLEISLNGQEYTSSDHIFFTFYQQIRISAAEQDYGSKHLVLNGGDPVTVHGQRLRYDGEARYYSSHEGSSETDSKIEQGLMLRMNLMAGAYIKPRIYAQRQIVQQDRMSVFSTSAQTKCTAALQIFQDNWLELEQDLPHYTLLQTELILP